MQVLDEQKNLSIIWLGMASKCLEHITDEGLRKEFDLIWEFWKTGKISD